MLWNRAPARGSSGSAGCGVASDAAVRMATFMFMLPLLPSKGSFHLERFRAKWIPVCVKKTRQNKNLELGSDSIGTEKALVAQAGGHGAHQASGCDVGQDPVVVDHQRRRQGVAGGRANAEAAAFAIPG